jgi:hypothetical protein
MSLTNRAIGPISSWHLNPAVYVGPIAGTIYRYFEKDT